MNPLLCFGAVFASIWMFQLRANSVTIFGDSIFIPDLCALLSAMAGYYLPRSQATAFVVIASMFADVTTDLRFGLIALKDGVIVQLLWPMRDVMWGDSKFSLFVYLCLFIFFHKLSLAIFLFGKAGIKDIPVIMPKIIMVSGLTAVFGVITHSAFACFLEQDKSERKRR